MELCIVKSVSQSAHWTHYLHPEKMGWKMQTHHLATNLADTVPAKPFYHRLVKALPRFFILLEAREEEVSEKSRMKPILPLPPIFSLFYPTCASVGPLPSQGTFPAPWLPLHHSCHSPDPIPAPNCPRPHTTQAPSQSTSKGRLHEEVSARFPRVTFLQGTEVVSPASIYPQPSASVKSQQQPQWKYCFKGVSCPGSRLPPLTA